jgi:hypothetical protein
MERKPRKSYGVADYPGKEMDRRTLLASLGCVAGAAAFKAVSVGCFPVNSPGVVVADDDVHGDDDTTVDPVDVRLPPAGSRYLHCPYDGWLEYHVVLTVSDDLLASDLEIASDAVLGGVDGMMTEYDVTEFNPAGDLTVHAEELLQGALDGYYGSEGAVDARFLSLELFVTAYDEEEVTDGDMEAPG